MLCRKFRVDVGIEHLVLMLGLWRVMKWEVLQMTIESHFARRLVTLSAGVT